MMAALLFIYLYNVRMLPLGGDARATIIAYANLGMAGFVVAAICLRFAYPSVSAEGKAFWMLQVAPVSYRELLRVKLLVYGVPMTAVAVLLTVFANIILEAGPIVWAFTIPDGRDHGHHPGQPRHRDGSAVAELRRRESAAGRTLPRRLRLHGGLARVRRRDDASRRAPDHAVLLLADVRRRLRTASDQRRGSDHHGGDARRCFSPSFRCSPRNAVSHDSNKVARITAVHTFNSNKETE